MLYVDRKSWHASGILHMGKDVFTRNLSNYNSTFVSKNEFSIMVQQVCFFLIHAVIVYHSRRMHGLFAADERID